MRGNVRGVKGAVGGPMIGGGVKREPKVKKNATDLACPECEVGGPFC